MNTRETYLTCLYRNFHIYKMKTANRTELASWWLQVATGTLEANLGKLLGLFLAGPRVTKAGSSCQQPRGSPATEVSRQV